MTADINYASYLRLDDILNAQSPRSDDHDPEHDEMLFIVIHQVYELWFKQMLHEMDYLLRLLDADDLSRALNTFKRVLTILKTVVTQIDVLETMSPLEFNSFRGYLASSSGFQSGQFRELEFLLGYKRHNMLTHFTEGTPARINLEQRYQQKTLWDVFMAYLARQNYDIPDKLLSRDVTEGIQPSPEFQQILIDIYRNDPANAALCERLVDLDEGLQEWRYRHVKMVERTIGMKKGTGGSAGVAYLQSTLKPFFPDLWAIRIEL
ncbi:MAG: tryptophan 2,3-dioxygenase [Aggregatilineales bacterium]